MQNSARLLIVLSLSLILFTAVGAAQESDRTVTKVELSETSDADVSIELMYILRTDDEVAAFEDTKQQLEEQGPGEFGDAIESLVQAAEQESGRDMSVRNMEVTARQESVPNNRGIIIYSFTWVNFTRIEGEKLIMDDMLNGYLLLDDDELIVSYPDIYTPETVEPAPDTEREGEIKWKGYRSFGNDQPRLILTQSGEGLPVSTPIALAMLVLLVIAAAGVYFYRDRLGGNNPEQTQDLDISDDEKIISIIEKKGGRVKQKDLSDETGWSAAKVSQVVSQLENEGRLEKLKQGRENMLELT